MSQRDRNPHVIIGDSSLQPDQVRLLVSMTEDEYREYLASGRQKLPERPTTEAANRPAA
ncbi:MAG: hypothetical protein ACYDAG_05530 [Chloroflexota bacterium]